VVELRVNVNVSHSEKEHVYGRKATPEECGGWAAHMAGMGKEWREEVERRKEEKMKI
jgi:hypothetical protein